MHQKKVDFSQNVSFRPKAEVQSAHVLGKQFTLYCAIVEPVENRYLFHLSSDRKHDGRIVDQALRDIISAYEIQNEDLWTQSENAPSQYKSNIPFGKESALKHMKDPYGHFIHTSELLFKQNCLKLTRSQSLNNKKF